MVVTMAIMATQRSRAEFKYERYVLYNDIEQPVTFNKVHAVVYDSSIYRKRVFQWGFLLRS